MTTSTWRAVLQSNITSFKVLTDFLQFSEETLQKLDLKPQFILNVPRRVAEKMAKDDPTDPLFLQFVPLLLEREHKEGFVADPVCDRLFVKEQKLIKKYSSRALIITTGACAMHCRFCFRQNFPYETEDKSFAKDLALIESDTTIEEVILSGGDPLSLPDRALEAIIDSLEAITHVKRIRFHSRFPIGIPERIDDSFISVLKKSSKQFWFALHSNHPNEFDDTIWAALKRLQNIGIPILNQAVLLKGVNDTIDTLEKLSQELVNHGVFPYYLHQLDRVAGAGHFEVPIEKGKQLIELLLKKMSGYAVPKYVQEIAGEPSKTPL